MPALRAASGHRAKKEGRGGHDARGKSGSEKQAGGLRQGLSGASEGARGERHTMRSRDLDIEKDPGLDGADTHDSDDAAGADNDQEDIVRAKRPKNTGRKKRRDDEGLTATP